MWVEAEKSDCWLRVDGLRIAKQTGDQGETVWLLRGIFATGAEMTVAYNITEAEARQLLAWFGEALLHDHRTFSIPFHLDLLRNGKEAVRNA
jgi:hypothetical protein